MPWPQAGAPLARVEALAAEAGLPAPAGRATGLELASGTADHADDEPALRRRALLLAALSRPRYASIVVAGCGGGALAVELAARCDRLTLVEPTETARAACSLAVVEAGYGDRLAPARLGITPDDWPDGPHDLVLLHDYACWLDAPGFARLITHVLAGLVPGGELLCCDPRMPPADAPLTGDYVHARLRHELALEGLLSHVERDFRLDSWTRLADPGL